MPIFEHQYQVQVSRPGGQKLDLSPADSLRHVGPVLPVTISPTKQHVGALAQEGQQAPTSVPGLAIIDTGASVTAVDESVCQQLGIQPTDVMRTAHAGGVEARACYPIEVAFPGTPLPAFAIPRAMSVNLQAGKTPYILLFGRDLLTRLKFVYHGPAGRIEIAF